MSEIAAPDNELLGDIEEAMRDVVDPELGINVVDLGLVYGVNLEEAEEGTVALRRLGSDEHQKMMSVEDAVAMIRDEAVAPDLRDSARA